MKRSEASIIGAKADYIDNIDYLISCYEENKDEEDNYRNCTLIFTDQGGVRESHPVHLSKEHTARIAELLKKFISEFDEEIKDL